VTVPTFPDPASYDWPALVADLNALLRLKTTITGMKLFERIEDREAIPCIRRTKRFAPAGSS
jgi:hypothetical protein